MLLDTSLIILLFSIKTERETLVKDKFAYGPICQSLFLSSSSSLSLFFFDSNVKVLLGDVRRSASLYYGLLDRVREARWGPFDGDQLAAAAGGVRGGERRGRRDGCPRCARRRLLRRVQLGDGGAAATCACPTAFPATCATSSASRTTMRTTMKSSGFSRGASIYRGVTRSLLIT
uniref:Uncharacterized protein n=1 Tax=Oryza meridionalis TaxID=40149 RepID=A0A0E0E7G4_9ORYZ